MKLKILILLIVLLIVAIVLFMLVLYYYRTQPIMENYVEYIQNNTIYQPNSKKKTAEECIY
jgi:hypothetical protein